MIFIKIFSLWCCRDYCFRHYYNKLWLIKQIMVPLTLKVCFLRFDTCKSSFLVDFRTKLVHSSKKTRWSLTTCRLQINDSVVWPACFGHHGWMIDRGLKIEIRITKFDELSKAGTLVVWVVDLRNGEYWKWRDVLKLKSNSKYERTVRISAKVEG